MVESEGSSFADRRKTFALVVASDPRHPFYSLMRCFVFLRTATLRLSMAEKKRIGKSPDGVKGGIVVKVHGVGHECNSPW